MAVRAKDIAAKLGLSQPTVSRALSGDRAYSISESTRELIITTARDLGYRPNGLARSLRKKETGILGVLIEAEKFPDEPGTMNAIYDGIQHSFALHKADLLLYNYARSMDPAGVYGRLVEGYTDGILAYIDPDSPLVPFLQRSSLPVVAVADAVAGMPSVVSDDEYAIESVLDHLWGIGHRRFAYCGLARHDAGGLRRHRAYQQYMCRRGLEADSQMGQFVYGRASQDTLEHFLDHIERPTVVVCWNDRTAMDLLKLCALRSIRVPEDVAVVALTGASVTEDAHHVLTTIRPNWTEMAHTAVRVLLDRINGIAVPAEIPVPCAIYYATTS